MSGALALLLEYDPDLQRENSQGRTAIQNVKAMIMENSQMKEGQSEHDDPYGYGHLRVDLIIGSMGEQGMDVSDDQSQAREERTSTISIQSESVLNRATRMPPVSSAKPRA